MASFTQISAPEMSRPDPAKHVNFVYGMLLGVDDFRQEFAYHAGRDRWLVRGLGGYGTVLGLRVRYETAYEGTDRGPRVSVSPGSAAGPSGQITHVAPTQCAYLDEWLVTHQQEVTDRLGGSPPGGALDLYVVLCYRDCLTDRVPIPGEPCRTEDDLRLPSRLRDDFALELRFAPADQAEEDAVRQFVAWLRQIPVDDSGAIDLDGFVDAIRGADFLAAPPPPGLVIPELGADDYLRAAFRLWSTELLPRWRSGANGDPSPGDADCVTLAHLVVDVLPDVLGNRLVVGPAGVTVDEEDRPCLVDLRVLQEWAITSTPGLLLSSPPSPPSRPARPPRVVAGGRFGPAGNPEFSHGDLTAVPRGADPDVYDLDFADFDPAHPAAYVVQGCCLTVDGAKPRVFEVLTPGPGLAVRLRRVGQGTNDDTGFMLTITRFDGGA
jgi:hypothetical protein